LLNNEQVRYSKGVVDQDIFKEKDMTASNVVAATLQLKLKADSGYTSEESHRISADQWGDVLRVATGQLSSAELDQLRGVCAEAYQFAGAYDAPIEVLDNLSAAANGLPLPHKSFLPVMDSEAVAQRDRLLAIVERFASIMDGCGNWPDTSTSQVSLGDLANEAEAVIAEVKGGAA
jgi:hypothetical protein